MSGGAAILAVNVVIGLYALVAYKENVAEQKEVEAEEAAAAVWCLTTWPGNPKYCTILFLFSFVCQKVHN